MTAAGKSSGKKSRNGLSQMESAHFFSLPNITSRVFDIFIYIYIYTIWHVWVFFIDKNRPLLCNVYRVGRVVISIASPRVRIQGIRNDSLKYCYGIPCSVSFSFVYYDNHGPMYRSFECVILLHLLLNYK